MTKRQQLYILLDAFLHEKYDEKTFCDAFEDLFYPNVPKDELSEFELLQFEALGNVVTRFTPFEEDAENYPGIYRTKADVKKAANICSQNLEKERLL